MRKARRKKIFVTAFFVTVDILSIALSMFLSTILLGGGLSGIGLHHLVWFAANVIVAIILFAVFGVYRVAITSVSVVDALRIVGAVWFVFVANLVGVIVDRVISLQMVIVYCLILVAIVGGIRFSLRIMQSLRVALHLQESGEAVRTLIAGAGRSGDALIREMQSSDKITYNPVCLVDDDETKLGKMIGDVKVLGTTNDIPALCEKYKIDEIIIAMPSSSKKDIKRILDICGNTDCSVKTLPGIYQLVNGEVNVRSLRKVDIADLLGRDQVRVNIEDIIGYIEGETVLVTGGGGSIGSELCRQIASHHPGQLIILDIYENNAYDIEQELKRQLPNLDLVTLIASIRDKGKVEDVFKKYRPTIVFNAAAHKHVPLMETSPNEAVKNNVFGTLNVARCADEYGVKVFVQISTDKAVNPTNVMGATKRICEMIVQTIGRHSKNTKFVAVRFGNVLGSNGSVIPLFKQQIKEGGPVTVTHRDITRYFMTIPEAVSLVLQAGAYAKDGQIFVLDMGEPVRIYDLAYNLIKLSGLEPNVDIEIKCTGLRPGEKLYEERLMDEEGLQKTPNGLINIANPIKIDEEFLFEMLDKLYEAAYAETNDMKKLVSELVPTYKITDNK